MIQKIYTGIHLFDFGPYGWQQVTETAGSKIVAKGELLCKIMAYLSYKWSMLLLFHIFILQPFNIGCNMSDMTTAATSSFGLPGVSLLNPLDLNLMSGLKWVSYTLLFILPQLNNHCTVMRKFRPSTFSVVLSIWPCCFDLNYIFRI